MFELKCDFDFNGDDLEKAVLKAAAESVTKTVRSMRCPTHGEGAKIIVKGRTVEGLDFEISGCCDELTEAVTAKISKLQ